MKAGFTMKALSLAVLGLAGLGYGASAMAVCPTDPAAPAGPWASKSVSAGGNLSIANTGLNGTSCSLQVSLTVGSSIIAKAFVTDTTPADEPHYRARFYIDTTQLTGLDNALKQVQIFTAAAQTGPAATANDEVQAFLIGGAGPSPSVRLIVADSNQGSKFQSVTIPLPNPLGVNRIEFDLVQGASASFRYWVSAGNTATSDGSPTGSLTVNNTGWSGITQSSLGEFSASAQFRSNAVAGQALILDEFDSRRTTFIGQ